MSVATLLGFGAVAVLIASVVAAFVRQPTTPHPGARPTARQVHAPSTAATTASSSPLTATGAPTTGAGTAAPRHHTSTHVLGQTVQRTPHRHGQALPFTGSTPVVPTSAIGLLAVVAGSWMLVRWPAGTPSDSYDAAFVLGRSVTARKPRSDGAIDRLRWPGHQLARPSSAAIDGTSNDRTTNVSSNSPAVRAKPVS
jgi:hypothetical protein